MLLSSTPEVRILDIAQNEDQILDLADAVVGGAIPGFQIESVIFDSHTTLELLAYAVQRRIPAFSFNAKSALDDFAKDMGQHFDEGLIGISVHQNFGEGVVRLRATMPCKYLQNPGFIPYSSKYSKMGMGPWYVGGLTSGETITVFAENNMEYSYTAPAIHEFRTLALDGIRKFRRFTCDPNKQK